MIINLSFGPPPSSLPGCISCSVWFLAPYATFLFPGCRQQGVALLSPPLSCLWMWEAIPFHFATGRRRQAYYPAQRNWLRVHFYRRSARTTLFLLCYWGFQMYYTKYIAIVKIAQYGFWQVHGSKLFVCIREVSLHLNIAHAAIYSYICVPSIAKWLIQGLFWIFTLVCLNHNMLYASTWSSCKVLILCITEDFKCTTLMPPLLLWKLLNMGFDRCMDQNCLFASERCHCI